MAKHAITIDEAVDNKVVDAVQDGLGGWLANQPWFVQRKDTIAVVLGFVAQALSYVGLVQWNLAPWVFWLIVAVAFLAQVGTIALTKAPITPSIVERAIDAARVAAQPKTGPSTELPVYTGPTTSGA